MSFELEIKHKFKQARKNIKNIRIHNIGSTNISDYLLSIDTEDILPVLKYIFN